MGDEVGKVPEDLQTWYSVACDGIEFATSHNAIKTLIERIAKDEAAIAELEARNRELESVIRGFNDLFVSEPRMYLLPCDPDYRMTYADSERVDAVFMKIDAAIKEGL